MNNYLVAVDRCFVRDTQIATNEYIEDYVRSSDDVKEECEYDWRDANCDLILGTFPGDTSEEVLAMVSIEYNLKKSALMAYKLSANN